MGWSFGSETKAEMVATLKRGAIASRITNGGRNLWVVREAIEDIPAYGMKKGDPFIVLYLLKWNDSKPEAGYKAISEDMGPVECDCPQALLDLAPREPSTSFGAEWRKRVADYHARRTHEWKPGDLVTVYGQPYTLGAKRNKVSWHIVDAAGRIFRTATVNLRPRKEAAS